MKRKMVVGAALALAVTGCFVANLMAQAQVGGAGAAQFKVGVVNIDAVFAKYGKATIYKKELDDTIAPFKGEAEKLKKQINDIVEYFKSAGADKSKKDAYDKVIVENRRKLEDLDRDVRKLIGKKQEDQLIVLYKDVVGATKAYAEANGITLVFGYGEPFEGTDLYSFLNISRKMQGMGLGVVPIWYHGSLDVTDPIIQTLNYNNKGTGATPTGGGK